MKKWVLILISLALLILDNSLMPFFAIKGAFPSLLFTFAIAYSIINGKSEAIFIGVTTGLMQDVFFYNGLGINAFVNMLICLIAAFIGENIYREKRFIPVISVIFLYIIKVLAIFVIFKLVGRTINIKVGMITALYSAVVMFLGYNFVLKLYDIKYKNRSWRFK
ncbi:rod shape-determining protein MreD [Clostridium sp. CTA-7]